MGTELEISRKRTPLILDGTFFRVEQSDGDGEKVLARCNKCNRLIKGSYRATSNFLLHLKKSHGEAMQEYLEYKSRMCTNPQSSKRTSQGDSLGPPAKRRKSSDQEKADKLIVKYITSTGKSLSTVDEMEFNELVSGLCRLKTEVTCMTRKTLKNKITDEYQEMIDEIRRDVANSDYVCTTADIWSSYGRSFLGMTVHWIDKYFKRSSQAIACRRMTGSHNYIAIAKMINEIHDEFGLDGNKLVCTVTDNGSNFVKAFKEFNFNPYVNSDEDDAPNEAGAERTPAFYDIASLNPDMDSSSQDEFYSLPKHIRCCSHTLSLIGSNDVKKAAKENQSYGKVYQSAMTKCSNLWNKVGRSSSKINEIFRNIAGSAPKTPCPTRWNSLYDSIIALLKVEDKLKEICDALDIPAFVTQDIEFLREYVRCLRPIAFCLDQMQAENDIYLGDVLPWILAVRYNLDHIDEDEALKYCQPLKECLLKSVNTRFASMLDFENSDSDFMIASVAHPKWKLRWLSTLENSTNTQHVRNIVLNALEKISMVSTNEEERQVPSHEEQTHSEFFGFMETPPSLRISNSHHDNVEMELMRYLTDRETSFKMLDRYENVKRLFYKFNTAIPSSAPVERLFSFAGLILRPRRSCLRDDIFERCTLLKANSRLK